MCLLCFICLFCVFVYLCICVLMYLNCATGCNRQPVCLCCGGAASLSLVTKGRTQVAAASIVRHPSHLHTDPTIDRLCEEIKSLGALTSSLLTSSFGRSASGCVTHEVIWFFFTEQICWEIWTFSGYRSWRNPNKIQEKKQQKFSPIIIKFTNSLLDHIQWE